MKLFLWSVGAFCLFMMTRGFQWFCHHTYHAASPSLAGYGGCVDEFPSGLGGVDDQRLVYEFAQQLNFYTMGGGGHTHGCFDVLCLCSSTLQRCAKAVVLDNGHPGDVSVPVYAQVSGVNVMDIGPYCQGANAALPVDSVQVVGNLRRPYQDWVRFSKPTSLEALVQTSACTYPIFNGTNPPTIPTTYQTVCYTVDPAGVWVTGLTSEV